VAALTEAAVVSECMFLTPTPAQHAGRTEHETGFPSGARQQSGGSFLFPGCGPPLTSPTVFSAGTDPALESLIRPQATSVTAPSLLSPPAPLFTPVGPARLEPRHPSDDLPPLESLLDAAAPPSGTAVGTASAASLQPAPLPLPQSQPTRQQITANTAGHWVTVFGYLSSAMLSQVLEELRPSNGAVQQHSLGVGPWVHIRYSERGEALQAIAKNGRVFHGCMLGVIDGIVPAGSVCPHRVPQAQSLPLRLHHTRGDSYLVASAAMRSKPHHATGIEKVLAMWNAVCEYVLGW